MFQGSSWVSFAPIWTTVQQIKCPVVLKLKRDVWFLAGQPSPQCDIRGLFHQTLGLTHHSSNCSIQLRGHLVSACSLAHSPSVRPILLFVYFSLAYSLNKLSLTIATLWWKKERFHQHTYIIQFLVNYLFKFVLPPNKNKRKKYNGKFDVCELVSTLWESGQGDKTC